MFDPEPPGGGAILEFVYTTDERQTGGCAVFRPDIVRIFHGPNFQSRLSQMGANQARAGFKHELGHFLGLDHTSSPTLMTPIRIA